eukprot:TRINITY_DN14846_c1_g1_i1.p1 TRINITY_DN14846_c1_g1~~TRINITY_DN14846_c1_g1_i1.p1  ORF type:complete len:331 (+),score=64.09 TRINITY_DN14846_c1_g1_i1:42-1034(+)
MKPLLFLASLPAVALGFSGTQESGPLSNQWICGHALISGDGEWLRRTPTAGILIIDPVSGLDYIRRDEKETRWASQEELARWDSKQYRNLFCHEYLSQYKTPTLSSRLGGVCVRNITEGGKWNAILEADKEAQELHEHFATQYGYQKSAPKYKDPELDAGHLTWGSGSTGSSPANWCHQYMKQMLCHIAFPQFAGNEDDLAMTPTSFAYTNGGAPVRPVCSEDCKSMMDNCNRRQPCPSTQFVQDLFDAGNAATINPGMFDPSQDGEEELTNDYYCASWNRGIGLARAGTGVGEGTFDNEEAYCAKWDSSAVTSPFTALVVAAMAVVALL